MDVHGDVYMLIIVLSKSRQMPLLIFIQGSELIRYEK